MEYLPQRRWSSLEKKRANIMIKAIDKQLKERRIMRSFKKYRYDIKKSKSKNKGKVLTEMELVLEQTQQGTSYDVLVSVEGVEELKRKVKINGKKKEALLILRQKPEFELKKILIDKMDESQSYLTAAEHREFYDGLIKSYDLDKSLFSTYEKVYSLKRIRKDKDKDEDPSARSDWGLKKRKTSKDAEPTKDQEENLGDDDDEETKRKTPQQGPTQSWLMTLASSADKPSKTFDELMSTPIYFSAYIMNGLKITNLTQETLLGPAFKLLKGTRTSYAELEYDFEECYKALSEKLDWDNPEGSDYPFDLTKPLSLVMNGNRQMVSVDYFFNNDLKYLQGGISTMTYTTSITKTKATQYDPPGIEDMEGDFPRLRINDIEDMLILIVQNRLTNLLGNDVSIFAIALGMFTRSMVIQKRVEDLQLGVESYQKKINVTKPETTRPSLRKKDPYTPYQDPQGFIYVDTQGRNRLMRDELYKFSDDTLTRL
ncbi:hypothetical protein Tco_1449860 [Tanacetum coccineum]